MRLLLYCVLKPYTVTQKDHYDGVAERFTKEGGLPNTLLSSQATITQ